MSTEAFSSPTGSGVAPSYWKDTGCEVSPTCLECPLAKCKFDDPTYTDGTKTKTEFRAERYKRIFELRKEGMQIEHIALGMKVGVRTVQRAITLGGIYPSHGVRPSRLSNEKPKVDPCDLMHNTFKARKPGFAAAQSVVIYPQACVKCSGSVRVDFHSKTAACLMCGMDVTPVQHEEVVA